MKTCAIVVGLLLVASCAHDGDLSSTSSPVDIDGTWSGKLAGAMGGPPTTITYNFKVDGDILRGTVTGGPDKWIPIRDGKIEGNKISFTVDVDFPGGMKMIFDYKGKIKGDKIKLSYTQKTPGGPGMGGFGMGGGPTGGRITVKRVK